ncbi:MAG: monovalent cation:proton antiporter-2 (CPA2) family protein [Gammaproteobacteria bacterium]
MTEIHYLTDILVLLAAAVIAIPVFQRLGLGAVLGYLAAGAVVGPWGLGFIDKTEEIRNIAEFGVIFLLFIIGIELKPARLWAMRRMVVGLGTAQVLVTGLVIAGLALLFGQPLRIAVIIGFGLALSSTAFGLQILTERGEMGTSHGQTAFSVLLLQDLAVVPLLALVSLLAAETALLEGVEFAILEAVLVIAFVILIGRFVLSPVLRLVATSRTAEVFTAAAVFAVLGTAWLMEAVGLSLALGAFLAGLMMADSHYRHQLIADIQPFRGILLGLFFMGVGMTIDFGLLGRQSVLIAGLVLGLLLIKSVILWVLCRLMGVGTQDAVRVSMLLSQSGEFGFVLFGLAVISGVLPEDLFHILTLLVALTLATTPLMANFCEFVGKCLNKATVRHDVSTNHIENGQPHVIIAGFGRVGRRVARILQTGDVPYLAIDSNADRVLEGRHDGFSVFYGDASQVDVLKAAGAGQAGVLVCTLDHAVPAVRLVNMMRQHYPKITIHARGRDRHHCEQLLKAGATIAISETLEASLQIGAAVLNTMGVFDEDATALIDSFRKEYYG